VAVDLMISVNLLLGGNVLQVDRVVRRLSALDGVAQITRWRRPVDRAPAAPTGRSQRPCRAEQLVVQVTDTQTAQLARLLARNEAHECGATVEPADEP
jgi:hypothetical protein